MKILVAFISFFSFCLHAEGEINLCQVRHDVEDISVMVSEESMKMFPSMRRYAEVYPKDNPKFLGNPILNKMLLTQRLVVNAGIGDVAQVKYLLLQGVYVDSRRDEPYYTALTLASICGRVDIVKILIEAGADVNSYTPNFMGYNEQVTLSTTLSLVKHLDSELVYSEKNRNEIIRILEDNGAKEDVKEINVKDDTDRQMKSITKWFLKAGFKTSYLKSEIN